MAKQPLIETVTIPSCDEHEGIYSRSVKLYWVCPNCSRQRNKPYKGFSYDGSRRLSVHQWAPCECGHIDKYSAIRKEAAENGLNEDAAPRTLATADLATQHSFTLWLDTFPEFAVGDCVRATHRGHTYDALVMAIHAMSIELVLYSGEPDEYPRCGQIGVRVPAADIEHAPEIQFPQGQGCLNHWRASLCEPQQDAEPHIPERNFWYENGSQLPIS